MTDFVHLHLHSEYSILDSSFRVADIPGAVLEAGQKAVAITDSGALYGAVAFSRACEAAGVHPVIGCEISLTYSDMKERGNRQLYKLVLLCENKEGYRSLCRIVSESFTSSAGYPPRADIELLKRCSAGLICLSGGIDGPVGSALRAGDAETAGRRAGELMSIFGRDGFFIELENHGLREERQILSDLYAVSVDTGAGCVAANDVRYRSPEDAAVHSVLKCIGEGRQLLGSDPVRGEYYLKSAQEMESLFGGFTGALENSVKIAARCRVDFGRDGYHLPEYPFRTGESSAQMLRRLAGDGLERLASSGRIPAQGHNLNEYLERADYELSVIEKMGYDDYFLIVADYVGYAKRRGIAVGPGRGSGCGSLTAFATGITDIDPVRYGLYFERFLNPERVSMPDIDVDFDYNRRGEIVDYVIERYGRERVCQIISFGTLAARAAVRDAGRVHGADPGTVDSLCSMIPRGPDVSLGEALEIPALKEKYACEPQVRRIMDTAAAIEGLPRNVSVHPAGVVITPGKTVDYVPLSMSGDAVIAQYDMTTVEELGLLKFDLLALRNLTVIDDACREIRRSEPDFDISRIPENDPAAFRLLCEGRTSGIFQLDKEGMTRLIKNMRPRSVQDIMTAIALYRPGPMDSIPKYLECRRSPSSVRYPHPLLRPVLEPTYGCLIYQEQVMNVFRIMAGYTLGRADIIRRAMSKKKASALEAERGVFITGACEKGMSREDAGKLFDDMSSFAGYAFNKSHAAAYAVITYRTAWLKANRPAEFFAALLNSVSGQIEKAAEYIAEAEKSGVEVEKPDVNVSDAGFTVKNGHIVFGLSAIKGTGAAAAAAAGLKAESPVTSLEDFIKRMPRREMSKKTAEAFIRSGSLDSTGLTRSSMISSLEEILSASNVRNGFNPEGQMDIFSSPETAFAALGGETAHKEDAEEFSDSEMRAMEREYTGTVFTGRVRRMKSSQPAPLSRAPEGGVPSVVYIRVPSADSEIMRKCDNLCGIFDGPVPVSFYFSDTGRYSRREAGVSYSPYLMKELRRIAGEESVAER